MTTKAQLHELVDTLPETALDEAAARLAPLADRAQSAPDHARLSPDQVRRGLAALDALAALRARQPAAGDFDVVQAIHNARADLDERSGL